MRRNVLLVALVCLLVASAAPGQDRKIVKVKDRDEPYIGVLKEVEGGYEITREFDTQFVALDRVVSIEDYLSPEDEYGRKLAQIDKGNAEDHYELGQWAFAKGLMAQAKEQADEAVALKPDVAKYRWFLQKVEANFSLTPDEEYQQKLARIDADGADDQYQLGVWCLAKEMYELAIDHAEKAIRIGGQKPEYLELRKKAKAALEGGGTVLLEQADIYRIRLEELSDDDKTAVIEYRNKVLERFIEQMAGRREFTQPNFDRQFLGWARIRQVRYILDRIDRDDMAIKNDILIKSDPKFMIDFRSRVWPIVQRGCALSQCHGADRPNPPGELRLFNIAGRNVRADYTNFVILSTWLKKGKRLIDRDDPVRSLVLQFGLPEAAAKDRHPPKISEVYTGPTNVLYKRIEEWIAPLAGPPVPNYHLEYRAPFGMPLHLSGDTGLPPPTLPVPGAGEEEKKPPEGGAPEVPFQ